jgi:hypothetical protein
VLLEPLLRELGRHLEPSRDQLLLERVEPCRPTGLVEDAEDTLGDASLVLGTARRQPLEQRLRARRVTRRRERGQLLRVAGGRGLDDLPARFPQLGPALRTRERVAAGEHLLQVPLPDPELAAPLEQPLVAGVLREEKADQLLCLLEVSRVEHPVDAVERLLALVGRGRRPGEEQDENETGEGERLHGVSAWRSISGTLLRIDPGRKVLRARPLQIIPRRDHLVQADRQT